MSVFSFMSIKYILLFIHIALLSGLNGDAQNIPVVNFSGLQPMLTTSNDTTYIVNFWATWCQPCVKELPYFVEAENQLKGNKVKFIMVSMDFRKMIDSKLKPFLAKNKVPGRVILLDDPDSNTWIPKVNPDWDGAIPVTLIFNKEKSIFVNTSFENTDDLLLKIKSLKK